MRRAAHALDSLCFSIFSSHKVRTPHPSSSSSFITAYTMMPVAWPDDDDDSDSDIDDDDDDSDGDIDDDDDDSDSDIDDDDDDDDDSDSDIDDDDDAGYDLMK